MKVIPKLQQGNTIESDNTKVVRPEIHEPIKAKPRQYSIVDLGGEPSNDTRSAAERNRDYWHPIKGAKARFRASMSNETNPLVGIERTILPSAAGAALVTTPAAVVVGALGNMTVDKLTGGWGNWLEDKTGIPSEIGVYTNPGAWYGGAKGYKIGKDKLITKSIKGDADLAWNPINKNHWIFNKEARTPSNIAMATANRITPFLSKVEKLPLKVAAYKAAKRTNGGKSVRNPELVTMAHGGRFDFKKSPLLKKQEEINGKRDMRKKFIKSSRPTYKKRIKKAQQGMRFVSYNPVSNPTIDYTDITNPINPFSEYNFNTTYDKPTALVVPVRDTDETDVVANNPTAEPVINKSVASKPVTDKPVTKTANSTWKSPYTNRKQWSTELINAYKKAGITNDNAIRMLLAQDALESSWGKSAQGKYNFGNLTTGSSWKGDYVTGNDKNAKGEAIKQKFRSYNSMDEYAADKIQFLKRLYDFDENDDINKFVAKLTGSNKGKRRYAEATNYAKVLTGVYNGIPKGENGMIIKYQNPSNGIARRDAIKDYRPNIPNRIRKATPAEHIQSMINIYGQSEQPTVTSDVKSPWQHQQAQEAASKGYDDYMQAKKYEEGLHNLNGILTFTDYATLATGLGSLLSKGASMAGRYAGKQMAKRAVGKEFKKGTKHLATPNNMLPNNVGWGPRQSIHVVHDTDAPTKLTLYSPERWDAIHEGAPEAGIWYQGKLGNPRTAANHSIPGKAEKAAAARERFAKRPYRVEGDLELERPIVTVGDVPNRAALERAADKMGADGVTFNNVYDNGYSNNQVIFSLRDDLKNGTMTHKPTGKTVIPTENNPYPKIGTATMVDGIFEPTGDIFGEILPTQGTKHVVFKHKTDPTKVVKVYKPTEGGYKTLDELREGLRMYRARDEVPGAVPAELQGYLQGEKGMYPVFTQTRVGSIEKMSVLDELARMFEAKGWTRINDSSYKNSKITVGDITTENVGMLNGKPVIFDPEAAYNEDIIKVSNAKFKNK